MLKKIFIFLIFALVAYTFNVNLRFPWLSGVFFGLAIVLAMRGQKQVGAKKLLIVSVLWSSLLFFAIGIGVLAAVKDALDGIALGTDEAVKVALVLSIFNGLGFGIMRNILLSNLKWSRYHTQCLFMSFITGFILGAALILKSDYNTFLSTHIIWFVAMGWIITKNVNGIPNILEFKNSNH